MASASRAGKWKARVTETRLYFTRPSKSDYLLVISIAKGEWNFIGHMSLSHNPQPISEMGFSSAIADKSKS
jgi:hypothetical protein